MIINIILNLLNIFITNDIPIIINLYLGGRIILITTAAVELIITYLIKKLTNVADLLSGTVDLP